jgi:hypothetical protein
MSSDYRFRLNELYMLFWLNVVFLLWPAKRWAIPLTMFSFYFWAGRLKLNHEWLSGSVLYADLWLIPEGAAPLACAYVVLLELVVSWGLLASRPAIVIGALGQFALFHVESLSQIHWFYPALMGTMLSWFVLELRLQSGPGRATLGVLLRGRAPKAAYGLLLAFGALQLAPLLYRGDFALTGQGRIFALHMFQARQLCEVSARIHDSSGTTTTRNLKLASLAPRSVCDPVIYYARMQNLCRSLGRAGDADFFMKVKRTTEPEFTTIVDQPGFCQRVRNYAVFTNNDWMR